MPLVDVRLLAPVRCSHPVARLQHLRATIRNHRARTAVDRLPDPRRSRGRPADRATAPGAGDRGDGARRRDPRRHQALRRRHRRRPHGPAHRARRVLLAPRPVGLRQDDDPAHDRRLRAADRRRDPARRPADRRVSRPTGATSTRSSSTTPCSRTWTSPRTSATACASARSPRDEEQRRVERGAGPGPPRRLRATADVGDVRRPAAARRPRPGPGQPADGAAPRRAARRARPQAPQGDAARAQGPPARGRDHVRVRDPRPGRGAHDERRHRRHEGRPHPAAGRPDRALRAAGQPVRRGLHRHVELHRRRRSPGSTRRPRTVTARTAMAWPCAADVTDATRGRRPSAMRSRWRPAGATGGRPRRALRRRPGPSRSRDGSTRARTWATRPSTGSTPSRRAS